MLITLLLYQKTSKTKQSRAGWFLMGVGERRVLILIMLPNSRSEKRVRLLGDCPYGIVNKTFGHTCIWVELQEGGWRLGY
jgi:hypothetical protein